MATSWMMGVTALSAGLAAVPPAGAVEPGFTYQGQLKQAGQPVTGSADFTFVLWDADVGGVQLAQDTVLGVAVTNGLFAVEVVFGTSVFDGSQRWLEVRVAVPSGGPFTPLTGRQLITPAPYSMFGLFAPWTGLVGVPSDIADGDDDTHLAEPQVENYVVNSALDLAPGTTVGGGTIALGPHTVDTTAATICTGEGVFLDGAGNCVTAGGAGDGHSLDAVDGSPADVVFVDANGNVGVGTTTPAYPLHVAGDAGYDQDVWFRSPVAFEVAHETNTGFVIDPEQLSLTLEVDATPIVTVTDTAVGIGTDAPAAKLDVAGAVRMTGFQLATTPTEGYVLRTDAAGVGSWQPPPGAGDSLWNLGQFGVIWADAPVAIGHTVANGKLDVFAEDEVGIKVTATGEDAPGIEVYTESPDYSAIDARSTGADAVVIRATATQDTQLAIVARATGTATKNGYPLPNTAGDFYASGTGSVGVYAHVDQGAYGVRGQASSTSGTGVFGEATGAGQGNGVYGRVASANGRGVYGYATATTGATSGVYGRVASTTNGAGVFGLAVASTGTAAAVVGQANSPQGYAGKFYGGMNYFEGNVGIGTDAPEHPLHAVSADGGPVVFAEASGASSSAVYGFAEGSMSGVRGESNGPSGIGVSGKAWATEGDAVGVKGVTLSPEGIGVKGESPTLGWAGYFSGRAYVSGNVGIGTINPTAKLDVAGTVKATGIEFTTAPADGFVLTSDANGVASWRESSGGISLPFEGTLSDPAALLSLTNSGNGDGVYGESSVHYGVYGRSVSSRGVNGRSVSGPGVYGFSTTASGVSGGSNSGAGMHAVSSGTGTNNPAIYAQNYNANGIALFSTNSSTDANAVFVNKGSGNIIKGFSGPSGNDLVFKVTNDGSTTVNVLEITGGADLAEPFDIGGQTAAMPGMVVCIDAEHAGKLIVSKRARDRTVAGVISGAGGIMPGMVMGQKGSVADGEHPVALTGRVWTWCDATGGAIRPGDLLTSSDVAGHAMKVTEYSHAHGAIIGKAMTPLDSGRGLVLVLVSLQ